MQSNEFVAADDVQGQEFAEAYLLEYRRVDTGPWIRFRDRNNSQVNTPPVSIVILEST